LNHDECLVGPCSGKIFDDRHCSTTLPFRVIDVGPSDGSVQSRLWTTHGQATGRYLTLSHCWGKVEPPKTTKATLSAWHTSLPDSQMSKTFQDAIRLTRELGERFLWIDSLCIVQDDANDLDAQIGLMGTIFEGSYCTIAATDAKGVDGLLTVDRGLFISGPGRCKTVHIRFNGENENLSGELHNVFIIDNPYEKRVNLRLQDSAWHSRGWVFQERKLSRRCMFFNEESVGWRCNRYSETEQTGVAKYRERVSIPPALLKLSTNEDYNDGSVPSLNSFWEGYVRDYSQTRLTYISDKEKALKGLTEQLSSRFQATFHYGILDHGPKSNLTHQLLWCSSTGRANGLKGDQIFCFPSWSWMVVDGRVDWVVTGDLVPSESLAQIHVGESTSDGTQELHISGLGCTINVGTLVDDLPQFSEFRRWAPNSPFDCLSMWMAARTLLNNRNEIIGWITIDSFDSFVEVTATPLQQYFSLWDEEEPLSIEFLALVAAPKQKDSTMLHSKERHIRIGRGRVFKNAFNWLGDCQPRNFVVV
jgi:Heterokaryon incompatibility protein (HET)